MVTSAEWGVSDGRFGRGAQLGVVVAISNTGNRPIVIDRMFAEFTTKPGKPDDKCTDPKWEWTGMSWNKKWDATRMPPRQFPGSSDRAR